MDALLPAPSLRLLLDHFAAIPDRRQRCNVMFPLREVLLPVVCGTIACGDDYDDIVDWGDAHLDFLKRFSEFHFGTPRPDWLRVVMNRIDPVLFADCLTARVAAALPGKIDLVAIVLRQTQDEGQDLARQPRPGCGQDEDEMATAGEGRDEMQGAISSLSKATS